MSKRSEKILKLIGESGLSYGELSKITGIPKSALQRYATGETEKIPIDRIEILSKALNTTPAFLMGWEEEKKDDFDISSLAKYGVMPIKTQKIPLLGSISCGEAKYAEEDFEGYIEASSEIKADFCIRADGDSMIGARILDGDVVFIRKQDMVDNGEIAAVIIDNNATLKRVYYYPEKSKLILSPENPKYEPFVYIGEELNQIRILGKAVAFQSSVR